MGAQYTEAQARATAKYQKENTKLIGIRVQKERWNRYKAEAERAGKSISSFILDIVDEKISKPGRAELMGKGLIDEINNLSNYHIPDDVVENLRAKYWENVEDHRNAIEKVRADVAAKDREQKEKISEQNIVIRVLSKHIKEKGML